MTPSDRRAAIAKRATERRDIAIRLRSQGPSCLFCIHGPKKPERLAKAACNHPLFWYMRPDAVNGEVAIMPTVTTGSARSEDGLCGPEAELFEARRTLSRLWRALQPYLWPSLP